MSNPTALVQKLWNYCNILRDDGLSYGDYVEQLTFLLFLRMADEQSRPPFNPHSPDGLRRAGKPSPVPPQFSWPELLKRDGDELEIHSRHTLEELGKRWGGDRLRPPLPCPLLRFKWSLVPRGEREI